MKKALIFAAVAEVATGLALMIAPSLVGQLLLGAELTGAAVPVARVTGIALVALGIACWPGPLLVGMLVYTALVMAYLAYIGIRGEWVGPLLWPAVAVHAVLALLLTRDLLEEDRQRA
jgi:hypothetical protein